MEAMVNLVRSKEVNPGEALSCFKTYLREGTPDEQHRALLVLAQFVGVDPHLGNLLHMELASKRWRERFVQLAQSPHPEVKPLLISTLQGWAASYRAHDIGIHYQTTLRDIEGGAFRGGGSSGYAAQHTGYSTQYTGYSAQATGAGGYPPPGPTPPPGYPTAGTPGGYPPYGAPYGAAAAPAPYPPPSGPAHQPSFGRGASPADVSSKLDQLSSEVEQLRGAIRTFETALADYKAQRAPFSALSGALERGQRTADRCSSLQVQIENLVGHSDGGDEGLMTRLFSTNDSAVAALEQWKRLANQELAPEDAAPGGSSPAGGAAAAAAAPAPPAPPPKPAPTPLDLLLGDEIINPTPTPPPPPPPAFANGTGAGPSGSAPATSAGAFDVFGASVAGPSAAALTLPPSPPVVPASDMEGLRAQVLALSAELDKQRKVHATAAEAQEAFHRGELAQAKARIAELEAALSRQQSGGAAAAPAAPAAAPYGNAYAAPFGAPAPIPASVFPPMPAAAPAPAPVSNNPFAMFAGPPGGYGSAPPPAPSPAPAAAPPMAAMGSLQLNLGMPPQPPAPAPAPPADIMNAFDELAAATSLKASGGGTPVPMAAMAAAPPQAAAAPAAAPAAAAAPGGAGAGAGSWVNFGH
ncbi:hypothetical protein HXX76_011226 [Chlamydomonas incerta]|uniref:VHS domain-containing protein n=1 Tax=Chlamydomonas incerta TaxID=51695 RepID=A0A835VTR8_CHLIN|nr:hypothetical protein HXX76_011226 [Chlamydomonas incerta]|eukprot:KAG2428982.1 hypothetical protein HXX76_011226 [Chlamydomonas incerta]